MIIMIIISQREQWAAVIKTKIDFCCVHLIFCMLRRRHRLFPMDSTREHNEREYNDGIAQLIWWEHFISKLLAVYAAPLRLVTSESNLRMWRAAVAFVDWRAFSNCAFNMHSFRRLFGTNESNNAKCHFVMQFQFKFNRRHLIATILTIYSKHNQRINRWMWFVFPTQSLESIFSRQLPGHVLRGAIMKCFPPSHFSFGAKKKKENILFQTMAIVISSSETCYSDTVNYDVSTFHENRSKNWTKTVPLAHWVEVLLRRHSHIWILRQYSPRW